MYPVQLPSAPKVRTAVQRVSAKPAANLTFMFIPLLKFNFMFVPIRAPFRVPQFSSACLDPRLDVTNCAPKNKKGGLSRSSLLPCSQGTKIAQKAEAYCPEVFVAALAAPADFGVDK